MTYWELIIRRVGGPQGGHPLAQELEAQEAARGKISALSPSNLFKLFSTICFPFSTLFKPPLQPFTYPRSVTEKGHQVTQFLDSATCLPTNSPTHQPFLHSLEVNRCPGVLPSGASTSCSLRTHSPLPAHPSSDCSHCDHPPNPPPTQPNLCASFLRYVL